MPDAAAGEQTQPPRKRLLTGDRPTGKLHLGHYVGSIANRVRLQDDYDCYFIIADLHMLTTKPQKEAIDEIRTNLREMVLDYLACGIDPNKSTIYLQSAIPAVYQMNLIFEMLVTLAAGRPAAEHQRHGEGGEVRRRIDSVRPLSATRCFRRPTSSCRGLTSFLSARTTKPTSKSLARSLGASTSSTATSSPNPRQ